MGAVNSSTFARLVEELASASNKNRYIKRGEHDKKFVLVAEVIQALDYLPKEKYVSNVIEQMHGNEVTKQQFKREAKDLVPTILPGIKKLNDSNKVKQRGLSVFPDSIIESDNVLALVVTRRKKNDSFEIKRLAREYVYLTKNCNNKMPVMMMILGEEPPILVNNSGKLPIEDAIKIYLKKAIAEAGDYPFRFEDIKDNIKNNVLWITWKEISDVVKKQLSEEDVKAPMYPLIKRLAESLTYSIDFYS